MAMPLFALLAALTTPAGGPDAPGAARLSGAFLLLRRDVYGALGGHAAIHDEIVEDVALARRMKAAGCRVRLAYTRDLCRTRMYDTWRDLWQGLTRSAYPLLGRSPARLGLALAAAYAGAVAPWLVLAAGLAAAATGVTTAWFAVCGGLALVLAPVPILRDFALLLRINPLFALLLLPAAVLLCMTAVESAIRYHAGLGLRWKGRLYRPDTTRNRAKGPAA